MPFLDLTHLSPGGLLKVTTGIGSKTTVRLLVEDEDEINRWHVLTFPSGVVITQEDKQGRKSQGPLRKLRFELPEGVEPTFISEEKDEDKSSYASADIPLLEELHLRLDTEPAINVHVGLRYIDKPITYEVFDKTEKPTSKP